MFRHVSARCMAFSGEERERAARYHRPLYWAALTRLLLVAAVYAVCTTVDSGKVKTSGEIGRSTSTLVVTRVRSNA